MPINWAMHSFPWRRLPRGEELRTQYRCLFIGSIRGDAGPNTIRPPFGDRRPTILQGGFKQAYCLAGTIDLLPNWLGISCRKQKIIPALRFKRRWRVSS